MYTKDNLPSDINKRYNPAMYYNGITFLDTYNIAINVWQKGGTYYVKYLDDSGICRISSIGEIVKKNIQLKCLYVSEYEGRYYCHRSSWNSRFVFAPIDMEHTYALDNKLLRQLKEGEHFSKLAELAKTVYMRKRFTGYTEFDRLFQKIDKPIFEGNKKYFDFIRIFVGCNSEITKDDVVRYKKEIIDLVLETLTKNRTFQNYNAPVEILRLSNLTLTRDKQLEFLFEIKPEIRKLFEE